MGRKRWDRQHKMQKSSHFPPQVWCLATTQTTTELKSLKSTSPLRIKQDILVLMDGWVI